MERPTLQETGHLISSVSLCNLIFGGCLRGVTRRLSPLSASLCYGWFFVVNGLLAVLIFLAFLIFWPDFLIRGSRFSLRPVCCTVFCLFWVSSDRFSNALFWLSAFFLALPFARRQVEVLSGCLPYFFCSPIAFLVGCLLSWSFRCYYLFYPLLSPFSIFILKRSRFHQFQEPICYDDPPVPRWLLTFHFYGWLLPLPLLCLQRSFGHVVVVRIFAGVCIFEGVWRQQSLSQTS